MLRRSFLALALVALAGCGGDDPTGVDAAVVGSYTLRSLNGATLPVTVNVPSGPTLAVTSGSLTMKSDHTFAWELVLGGTSPTAPTTQRVPDVGTYTVSGSAVVFTSTLDGSRLTGTYANGNITVTDAGAVFVFTR